jgi:carbamoyltransferase
MNILGICGSIGWDGNISTNPELVGDLWCHGSGATLIMNGELKTAINEERFSRIRYEGNYPKLSIQNILDHNKLTKYDIDLVVYVSNSCKICFELKKDGYIKNKIQEYFPNCKVDFLSHHMAHSAATYYTSDFDEANILSFDAAGDHELQKNGKWYCSHFKFSQGKDLTLTELHSDYLEFSNSFGGFYCSLSQIAYAIKMNLLEDIKRPLSEEGLIKFGPDRESSPGKIMGLAAFGNYQKIASPEWFSLVRERQRYSNIEWEDCLPQLYNSPILDDIPLEEYMKVNPDDLAAWLQHQFEKYLLLFLSQIPKKIKRDNLCLGGGCALNIIANSKIIEQGIYKNVHVNTAPNDDGLHFGAALYKAAEYENEIILPDDIGYLGIPYTDEDIELALC